MRRLSLHYDGHADQPLLASVPMSYDFSPDRISGNKFSGVLVALPVDVEDPLQRVQRAREGGAAFVILLPLHASGMRAVSRDALALPG